jgi:hypothetical protein
MSNDQHNYYITRELINDGPGIMMIVTNLLFYFELRCITDTTCKFSIMMLYSVKNEMHIFGSKIPLVLYENVIKPFHCLISSSPHF